MSKPDISISASSTLVSGRRWPIDIDVATESETRVDFIRACIVGEQGWSIGGGKSRTSARLRHPELESVLMGPGVLQAGSVTRFSTAFTLPAGTPPTHEIEPAYARLWLRIHVSIPWRIDVRYQRSFTVRLPPPPQVVRIPRAFRSTDADAAHDTPRLELALASTTLIAGETGIGTCAVFHLDDSEPREVELVLAPVLSLTARGRVRERRGSGFRSSLTIPAGGAGTGVPFRFRVLGWRPPSFACETHTLTWWLFARTGSFFGPKLELAVPLQIVDGSAAKTTARLEETPPQLGDERVAAELARLAAARGWRERAPERADPDDEAPAGRLAIERELAGCRLHLAYSYRDEAGTFLVSRIDHPSLGLGLSVTPSSALRHVFFRDIEVDLAAWDRAHLVAARSAEQAIPVLRAIVPALVRCADLGTLVRWSDDALVYELPAAAVDAAQLEPLAAALELLAPVIAEAQRAVPPPPGLAVDVAAWHALARELDGSIAMGDLSIEGTFRGAPAELGLGWDAEARPAWIRVAVGDPEAASAELRAILLELPRPAAEVLAAPSAGQLVELVTRWPDDVTDLRVADGVASALYRLPAGEPPVADAARARELVAALRAVLVALDPGRGPYR